jgi:twitching motility protein PilT
MGEYIRDPNLNQLIHELNRESDDEAPGEAAAQAAQAAEASGRLEKLLETMVRHGATDLLLISGVAPVFRVAGELVRSELAPLDSSEMLGMFAPYLTERLRELLTSDGSADFSLRSRIDGKAAKLRLRVNLHRQRGELAAAIRSLPAEIPTLEQLNLPPSLGELVAPSRGLVLVCGPTGSGKSSTLAALLGELNQKKAQHVITIEDPVEYDHQNRRSIIEHVEIGRDASDFATALRAALRQDPDVILVGEMRDYETASIALTAAETGHLILSTLHTSDAATAIYRIIDLFPATQQTQIRQQLALALHAIVCQQLVPVRDGRSRLPAYELMIANDAVRNQIRRDKMQNLYSEITLGKRIGMITLEESLATLVRAGHIDVQQARIRANRPEEMESMLLRN